MTPQKSDAERMFSLRRPCADCPFRTDRPFMGLHPERISEIADSIRGGEVFRCHKTIDYPDDPDEDASGGIACAGARGTCENGGDPESNLLRVFRRIGGGSAVEELADDLPLHDSLDDWEAEMIERYDR